MGEASAWVWRCDKCGEPETIELLDGGGEDFGLREDELRCVLCHPNWDMNSDDDAALSVNPKFARAYKLYLAARSSRWARLELAVRRLVHRVRVAIVGGGKHHG